MKSGVWFLDYDVDIIVHESWSTRYAVDYTFTFSHLADAFIQSDLQMRTIEAIKPNKRAMMCRCYNTSQLA